MSRCIPLLMLSFRLLAIVPATIGTVINAHNVVHPPDSTSHTRIDFAVAACWVSVLSRKSCCDTERFALERSDWVPMLVPHERPSSTLASVLSPSVYACQIARASSNLLARDAFDALHCRCLQATGSVLGRSWDNNICEPGDSAVGDKQSWTHGTWTTRHLWAKMGLGRGGAQVWPPLFLGILCDGMGSRV